MPLARLRDACLLLGLVLLAAGLASAKIDWKPLLPRSIDSTVLAVIVAIAGLAIGRLTRRPAAPVALVVVLGVAALAMVGFPSLAATLLLLGGGLAAGTLFPRTANVDPLVRWVAGLGLVAAAAAWLLPFPVHRGPVWAAVLAALILWRRNAMRADLQLMAATLGASMREAPVASLAWAVVAAIAAAPAWLPMGNADDLAYHLTLGNEFLRYGHGRMDIGTQSWALAPWSTDLLHALATVMAGREGTGPLNAAWLVSTGLLIHSLGRSLGLSPTGAWLASMLYLSLPVTAFLSGSLQTEPPTAAALVALALAIPGVPGTRGARLPVIAALAGFCLGSKISNALLLVPFLAWLVVSWGRAFPWRALAVSALVGVFAAGASYAYGLLLTGNPVVPMFNAYFRTPWFPPENFVDATWQTGFGPTALWRMVFDTSRYFEGYAGAAGIVLVALVGGIPAALAQPRLRAVLLVGLAAMLLVFSQVQYVRYMHPALAVLVPALVAGLLPEGAGRWSWREVLLAGTVVLQVVLIPTSSWKFIGGALRTLALEGPRAVNDAFVPERAISERLKSTLLPTDRVLLVDPVRSHGAELPGVSVGTAWFTPLMAKAIAEGGRTPEAWPKIVERAGANHVMVYDRAAWPDVSAFLAARGARRVDANGAAELYWLPPAPLVASALSRTDAGEVVVNMPLDRAYPVLGQAIVELRCSEPGKPVAVAWTLPASSVPTGHWEWVICGPGGSVSAAVQFRAGPRAGPLHFTAKPAQPGSAMTVEGLGGAVDLRRDYTAETALYRWVRKPFCRAAGCDFEKPALQALPMGWITRFAEAARSAVPDAETPGPPGAADGVGAPDAADDATGRAATQDGEPTAARTTETTSPAVPVPAASEPEPAVDR